MVDFVDASHGWVLGVDNALRKGGTWSTGNGGRTWKFHAVANMGLSSIDFVDASHGWAAGSTSDPGRPHGWFHRGHLRDQQRRRVLAQAVPFRKSGTR